MVKTQLEKNFESGIKFLKSKNLKFKKLSETVGYFKYNSRELTFESLVKIIINQQLSNNVATTIFNKLKNNFFSSKSIAPQDIIKLKDSKFKDCGISKLISLNIYLLPASMLNTNSNLLLSKIRAVVELTETLK